MRIGIDARLYGLEHAGIGRYVKNLVDKAISQNEFEWTLYLKEPYYSSLSVPEGVTKILADVKHYTLKEQLYLPRLFARSNLDLLHVPHFNIPLLYRRPFVVTIHDILWHQVTGSAVTTLSPSMYRLKYQGYKLVVKQAVSASKAIIVPSNYVKKQLLKEYADLDASKITVTYEGVDANVHTSTRSSSLVTQNAAPYLLYVGSCYPHKNVRIVIDALKRYNQTSAQPLYLKIVSARDIFVHQLEAYVTQLKMDAMVHFQGKVDDQTLGNLYAHAVALVQPSLSEGFGLTGLEAMKVGVPVIAASAGAMPEIYDDAALWFDPHLPDDLVKHFFTVQEPLKRKKLVKAGESRVAAFSWDRMVIQTMAVYSHSVTPTLSV